MCIRDRTRHVASGAQRQAAAGCSLPLPSARELLAAAKLEQPIRLVGVSVSKLEASESEQLSLLEDPRALERVRRLNRTLDDVRDRFGDEAVGRASGSVRRADPASLSVQIKRGE